MYSLCKVEELAPSIDAIRKQTVAFYFFPYFEAILAPVTQDSNTLSQQP